MFGPHGRLLGFGNRTDQYHHIEYEDTFLSALVDPVSDKRIEFSYDFERGLVTSIYDVNISDDTPFRHVILRIR